MRLRLLIVIPTLDEAENLAELLPGLRPVADAFCVADGGSSDGTPELARELGARVVAAPRGRGRQLQAGAAALPAKAGEESRADGDGDVLLFLHADSRLPGGAREAIEAALFGDGADGVVGGAFRIRYSGAGRLLRLGARLANWRAEKTRCPLGDHAIFVRRRVFEELGGFRDWPLLEDLDFARRLARRGRTVLLPAFVLTSARRFERLGVWRTVATNWLILLLYFAGVSPRRLARLYGRPP